MIDQLIETLRPIIDRVRTDVTAVKTAKGQAWTREPLTEARLAKHLNGGPARGVCPIKAGESTTMLGLLDLDSHKGEVPWDDMTEVTDRVVGALYMAGLRANVWRSSGGSGMHVIVLWDTPQDAYSVRQALVEAVEECGYSNGAGGISKGEIEVFPKQDSVEPDKFGNQFILPLAGKSEPLFQVLGYESMGREAAVGMQWLVSPPVPVRERPVRDVTVREASGDGSRLRAALAAIPNDGDGLDYDEWRDVIFAIHHATGGEGLDLAHEFSVRSSKYNPEFLEQRVWPFIKADGGITEATIYAKAAEAGWIEDITEMFDVVELAAGDPEPFPVFTRAGKDKKIESTATNAALAVQRSDIIGYRLGFDTFMHRCMIAEHGASEWRPFRDTDYFTIRQALETHGFKNPGQELVREAVRWVGDRNAFDSAVVWGEGLAWDGVSRVETFFSRYLGCEDTPYTRAVGLYLWTALAGRCMTQGCKVDMVPALIGAQGSGKTTLVEAIAPTEEAFVEVNLGNRNEEQASRALRGKLVGEIAELRGLRSRDAEDIKAWITRRHEEIRALYSEFHAKYARRLVFIATGNEEEFLDDPTGERRWLPLRVGTTDIDAVRRDRDQLWAEGIALFRSAGVQWRDAMTLARDVHSEFKVRDPWQEPVSEWLGRDGMDGHEGPLRGDQPFTLREVLVGCLHMDVQRIDRKEELRMGRVLRELGFTKRKVRKGNTIQWAWMRAEKCK